MTGTVRWFEPSKGFEPIQSDDGAADVSSAYGCVAAREIPLPGDDAVTAALEPGGKVEFDVVEAPHGLQATHVGRVEPQALS